MSNSPNGTETRPGHGDSLSQLLHVAKKQLQDIALGKRCVLIRRHVVTNY